MGGVWRRGSRGRSGHEDGRVGSRCDHERGKIAHSQKGDRSIDHVDLARLA